jgi:NodT family efflux transporter outer membrane factor (OMF) lipoprotein
MFFRLRGVCRPRGEPHLLTLAAVVGALILFFGCTVGPDYVRPATVAPEVYKETSGWKVAEPKAEIVRGAWWEIYQDPQLNGLEEQVKISNQDIAVAEAQYRQARALVQAARAGYFPTVAAGAAYTRSRGSENVGPARSPGEAISDYLVSGNVSWELDLWGRIRRTVESSQANAQASAADLEGIRLSAQAELAQDYFQLCALDAQKELLEQTVAAYERILAFTKNRYTRGVASRADVLQAETQLKSTQAQVLDLGVQRAQLEHAVAVLIGKPPSVFAISATPLTQTPPPVPVAVPSELLERRPDIAAAERRIAAANAQIGVAVAAYYPTVSLSAIGGFQSSHQEDWLTWPSRVWALGAAVSETVFDAGLRRAQTDQARAAYEATVAFYRGTVLSGFQEVEDNLAALRILEEEASVQDEAVRSAQQSVKVSTNQYKAGIVDHLALLVVETIALNNERTAIDIRGRRMTASVLLIKALGGGWKSSDLPSTDSL